MSLQSEEEVHRQSWVRREKSKREAQQWFSPSRSRVLFCSILNPSNYECVYLHTCQLFSPLLPNHPSRVRISFLSLIVFARSSSRNKMNRQSSDNVQEASVGNEKPVPSRLLTKIYYPDTLYPDSYTFFTNRTSAAMDTHDQTSTNTDIRRPSIHTQSVFRQNTTEIETNERQNQSSVGITLFDFALRTFIQEKTLPRAETTSIEG